MRKYIPQSVLEFPYFFRFDASVKRAPTFESEQSIEWPNLDVLSFTTIFNNIQKYSFIFFVCDFSFSNTNCFFNFSTSLDIGSHLNFGKVASYQLRAFYKPDI